MNVLDAAYRQAHEYPGGAGQLAARLGIGAAVFNSKLNPNVPTHHLTLNEAVRMQQIQGRFDVLYAMADELAHVAIPMPTVGDEDISHAVITTCAEFGDYLKKVDAAMKDGKVTPNERKALEKELTELITAASHLQALLAAKAGR